MSKFKVISGEIPSTLGEVVTFNFELPTMPRTETGLLSYMVDTREGNRGYRINLNGHLQSRISLPTGDHFAVLHSAVEHLGQANALQFESDGVPGPSLNILNVVLFYED